MNAKRALFIGAGLLSFCVSMPAAQSAQGASEAPKGKPVMITRFFTGPDGLTHAEEIDVKFAPGGGVYNLLSNSGAQIRRTPPGRENGYHTASRRQYVITLSGHAELVLSGGQTIQVGAPGVASGGEGSVPARSPRPDRSWDGRGRPHPRSWSGSVAISASPDRR